MQSLNNSQRVLYGLKNLASTIIYYKKFLQEFLLLVYLHVPMRFGLERIAKIPYRCTLVPITPSHHIPSVSRMICAKIKRI